jgi:acetylglutamate kinase
VPVIAPIGLEPPGQPLNINADTVAGEVARALGAQRLIFLTDVDGVLDGEGDVVAKLDADLVAALRADGSLAGGMIPKIDACLRAADGGTISHIANGRLPRTLARIVAGEEFGTRIGDES